MRQAFFSFLQQNAIKDRDICLLTANLGFKLFDDFRSRLPDQFIDVGVAEQNMIGLASGLALSGKKPYCYSIIPFLLMRAYEQIRIDIARQSLNVKLIGVGGGFTYGLEGFTHHALEDLAIMRVMPGMHVVVPADKKEAEQLVSLMYNYDHPVYIRLDRNQEPAVHTSAPDFRIGKGLVLSYGKDVAIFAIGSMVYQAKLAQGELEKQGISVSLINMHTLKPLDTELIKDCAVSHRMVLTVEEHSIIGGLGSAVAEVLAESNAQCLFKRIGVPEELSPVMGQVKFLREYYGLSAQNIVKIVSSNFMA